MLSDELFSSVCGPPVAANTAISKDVGIYAHTLTPTWAVKSSFKKSSAPVHCLALNDTHVFAAQDQKAHVHVYSRARGNQEALVPFQERIRCLALAGDVLILGTVEGRLILWEVRFVLSFPILPPLFSLPFTRSPLGGVNARVLYLPELDGMLTWMFRPVRGVKSQHLRVMCRPLAALPCLPTMYYLPRMILTSMCGPCLVF
jgi:hypothetical protein